MKKQSTIGKQHLLNVHQALMDYVNNKSIVQFPEPIQKTVHYIVGKFKEIKTIQMKYEFSNPDKESDLKITLKNNKVHNINLFSLKDSGKIQPKNVGAKSFIEKYFHLEKMQNHFNGIFNDEYKLFLQSVIETKEEINHYDSITILKKKVDKLYPSFKDEINSIRKSFLFTLREKLYDLFQKENTLAVDYIRKGFKELMLLDSINIITRYQVKNKCSVVEEWNPDVKLEGEIEFYKKGNETLGIRMGQAALTLRFKFERKPNSSIKLTTSYDEFPIENERKQINHNSLNKLKKFISEQQYTANKNEPNAIGKCNEALVYASFIEKYPQVYQVDTQEYISMYATYSPKVKESVLNYLQNTATLTTNKIEGYLKNKYGMYELESIQLVPQNYLKNRLDTADMQLIIKVNGQKMIEDFSLKAAAKRGSQITIKNPGIGTILGAEFFAVGTMLDVVERVKSKFSKGCINHQQSLEEVSKELGLRLSTAQQANLRKGLSSLFGNAPTVVTFYEVKQCVIKEHKKIESTIQVLPETPTPLNTTLKWNDGHDQIKLRMKFSRGQSKGWSSLKLAGEYIID